MKPSRRFLLILTGLLGTALILGTLEALGLSVADTLHTVWWGALLALLLMAGGDAVSTYRRAPPILKRTLPGQLSLGRWSDVQLTLYHSYPRECSVTLFDHIPASVAHEHLPLEMTLKPGQQTEAHYRIRPLERGHIRFPACDCILPSPLGFWQRRYRLEHPGDARVYPDFARLYSSSPLAGEQWLGQLGVRQKPRRGLGLEFHQLREFRQGDTLRQMDWKATARKKMPIAREYQEERDQQILLLLDCGRRMRSQDGELSHFDQALDACLLLAHVALRQGDAVGISTFAHEQPRHVAPAKGHGQLGRLLNAVYDIKPTLTPADYSSAAQQLLSRQRRRALIVLVTNLRDEDDDDLRLALGHLGRQHRMLIASLREDILDTKMQQAIETYEDALEYCGAMDYRQARESLHERLSAQGVALIDTRPAALGPELVNQYLTWKRAGTL
ncbi:MULTISPECIES: DUF58 domain-containing protein [Pseudomonas]|uniref:DUF58 domain-containing protein n=1 Tax=Pseudomonas TaxID=286 RepID=UPI00257CD63F|nr:MULTISPECIES: DUF58 domain-containing protein [unclassified Pseudomonas]